MGVLKNRQTSQAFGPSGRREIDQSAQPGPGVSLSCYQRMESHVQMGAAYSWVRNRERPGTLFYFFAFCFVPLLFQQLSAICVL